MNVFFNQGKTRIKCMYLGLCKIQLGPHSFIILLIFGIFVFWKVRKSSGPLQKTNILRLIYPLAKVDFLFLNGILIPG